MLLNLFNRNVSKLFIHPIRKFSNESKKKFLHKEVAKIEVCTKKSCPKWYIGIIIFSSISGGLYGLYSSINHVIDWNKKYKEKKYDYVDLYHLLQPFTKTQAFGYILKEGFVHCFYGYVVGLTFPISIPIIAFLHFTKDVF